MAKEKNDKKRFICTLIILWYKVTANNRNKYNNDPKKVINTPKKK